MKKTAAVLISVLLLLSACSGVLAAGPLDCSDTEEVDASVFEDVLPASEISAPGISAPSAILLEKETGKVIFEKDADAVYEPASVTKVMTILLTVEAIEAGTVSLDDEVRVSAHAASMGGSQVFLEEGEAMKLGEMLKCIVVASANDAAVAVAEHIAGTEDVFVSMMNKRAKALGMTNTNFTNCTGLMDDPTHVTTARDISLMSRELISHDMIKEYTTIWTDTVRDGQFGLANTNKLIRFYEGATGLKTGFTGRAKYCLSATAMRDGVEYIAVVMHCDTSADRFESAKALLSYAFSNYTTVAAAPDGALPPIHVELGKQSTVQPRMESIDKLLVLKNRLSGITKETELAGSLRAPVCEGDRVGTLTVYDEGVEIASVPIVASHDVDALGFWGIFGRLLRSIFKGGG